jgi:Spy/CpxP family protein refolding chaperone
MKTRTLTLSILLLAVILAPLAMAQRSPQRGPGSHDCPDPQGPGGFGGRQGGGFGGHPGMGRGDMGQFLLGRMGDKLGLTEEQRTEIKGILENCKENQEATKGAIPDAMKALHKAAEDGDEAAVDDAAKALADAFKQKALQKAATMKAVKALLTDEQVAQLDEIKAEMKERMQQRREKGQDSPRGKHGKGRKQGPGGQQPPPQEEE